MTRLLLVLSFCFSLLTLSAQNTTQIRAEVFFLTDKHDLSSESRAILEGLNNNLKQLASYSIFVKGNTDADGSNSYNQQLSEKRVARVKAYLTQLGIPADAFNVVAVGEAEPIADNSSDDGKQKNRRVDIIVHIPFPASSITIAPKKEIKSIFDKDKKYPIQKLYDFMADSAKTWTINNSEATYIAAPKGTMIAFPANTFNVLQGEEVTIKIHEAYNWQDIIAANIGTQTSDKPLVTSGMIQIEATYKGKPITADKDYILMMPTQNNKETGTQLFTGTRNATGSNAMIWNLPKTNEYAFYLQIHNLKEQREKLEKAIKDMSDTCGCSRMAKWEIDSAYRVSFKKKNKRLPQPPQYIDSDRSPKHYHFNRVNDSLSNLCLRLASQARSEGTYTALWFWRLKWQDKHSFQDSILYQTYNIRKYDDLLAFLKKEIQLFEKAEAAYLEAKRQKEQNKTQEKINEAHVSAAAYEIFETRQLGWINCDRFSTYKNEQLVAIAVEMPIVPSADVKLIFPKLRMAMNYNNTLKGRLAAFERIPVNEDAVIVAMKIEDGETYLSMTQIKTAKQTFQLNFEKLDPLTLKNKLKQLNWY